MAIRINNKDYLNYEEQVLKNKKAIEDYGIDGEQMLTNTQDIENINTELSEINLALIGKKDKNTSDERIKTITKYDFVTDGVDKVLTINYGNTSTLQYDAVIIDLEGVSVGDGGNIVITLYVDISLQIHNSSKVTDLAANRSSSSELEMFINTPTAKKYAMIKGYAFGSSLGGSDGYSDLIGYEKTVTLELITNAGNHINRDLVIHFSNPVYMLDTSAEA